MNKAELINQTELYDDIITMDSFPARIYHENTHAVLSYNETDEIYDEAIDIESAPYEYEETDRKIEYEEQEMRVE